MAFREEDVEISVEELFVNHSFQPGLRPRGHEADLGDRLAAVPVEEDALGEEADEEQIEELLHDLMSRDPEGEDPAQSAEEPRSGESSFAGGDPGAPGRAAEMPPAAACRRQAPRLSLTPEARHDLRRLEDACQAIEDFEARNVHQMELKALLVVMFDHMRREHCKTGEGPGFERWWAVAEVYRRVLTSPEMATRRARNVLAKLLRLTPDELTERRVQHVLGRRKSKAARGKKKSRRRVWRGVSNLTQGDRT